MNITVTLDTEQGTFTLSGPMEGSRGFRMINRRDVVGLIVLVKAIRAEIGVGLREGKEIAEGTVAVHGAHAWKLDAMMKRDYPGALWEAPGEAGKMQRMIDILLKS